MQDSAQWRNYGMELWGGCLVCEFLGEYRGTGDEEEGVVLLRLKTIGEKGLDSLVLRSSGK